MSKLFILFVLCLTLAVNASSADTNVAAPAKHIHFLYPRFNSTDPNNPDAYECVSERAPDYYGIGVRLGIYFSWWTAWLSNSGMPGEVMMAQDQNAIFLFANIIALVRCTITFVITQLDALVMYHLGMGTVLGVLTTWGYRTCYYQTEGPQGIKHLGGFGTHLRLLLSAAINIFGMWYWMHGVTPGDSSLMHDVGPCGNVYTFMFAKVNAAGRIRIFYIIVSTFWTIYFGIMILASPIAGIVRAKRIVALSRRKRYQTSHMLHIATGYNYRELRLIFQALRAFNFFWMAWSMITVEFVLNYNHVDSVLGPGGRIYFPSQLIPMIIGAFSFVRLVYLKFEKIRYNEAEPTATVAREPTIEGSPQPKPKGKDLVRLFAPPKGVPRTASDFEPPKDTDIDRRVQHDPTWLRYLVAYLPWLSLLPRWTGRDEVSRSPRDPEKQNDKGHNSLEDSPGPSVEGRGKRSTEPLTFSNSIASDSDATHHDRTAVERTPSRFSLAGIMNRRQRTI